jgi:uncharacterized protein (TIGR02996 family)
MNDADALLRAIFDAPDDDAPRLVYADWLDEHGQPNHARFIRLQIATHGMSLDLPENARWKHELEQAWERCKQSWGALAEDLKLEILQFRRGFPIVTVTLPARRFVALSPNWWPRLPLRILHLTQASANVDAIAACPYLQRLTGLSLSPGKRPIPGHLLRRIFAAPGPAELRALRVLGAVSLTRPLLDALCASPLLDRLRHLEVLFQFRNERKERFTGSHPAGYVLRDHLREFGERNASQMLPFDPDAGDRR